MGLPILTAPVYEVKLLSVPKPVRYRPYLVKEEKLLLIAKQSSEPKDIETAVKQIITACTFGELDVEKLATFDLEYLFLLLRSRSVNNVVELNYECKAPKEGTQDGICHRVVPITVDLEQVKLVVPEGHTNKIMLTPTLGVTLKYPTVAQYGNLTGEDVDVVPLIAGCLDTVFTLDGEVTEISQQSREDVTTFVEALTIPQVESIRQFFTTMPVLTHQVTFACPSCGYVEDIVLRGLEDFFD